MSTVTLINHMGTDDSVVDAARVSFNKMAKVYTPEQNQKLLNFLAKHGHWSPFAHTSLSFRIEAPIFVARQLAKHQVGFAWNEVSRRYVDYEPTLWNPAGIWRGRSKDAKQGSLNEPMEDDTYITQIYDVSVRQAMASYGHLLSLGVCPEQARAVLPQAINTEWIWTGSLYGFHRVCCLRLHATAQEETKAVARDIFIECAHLFPKAWAALERAIPKTEVITEVLT